MNSLKIKELHLKNFKSFKKARIPLKSGLTVIVGSNGSGKSNILDSLLFALGITSLKLLRASRLTDLINQSAVENYGKVELTLQDGAKTWTVSRLIDNKGKSVYRLNDDRKSLNEVNAFLTEMGIRTDAHNIVAQGDVTRVLEKNPLERRQIIDEIAGIREFDEKKAEAEKELAKVDERLKDTRIVLNERISHLQKLEEEKKAALEFDHLENRKKQLKASVIFKEIESAHSQKKENSKKLSEIEKDLEEKQSLEKTLLEKEDSFRKKIEEINSFLLSENQRVYSEVSGELEKKRASQAVAEEKKFSLKNAIERNIQKEKELKEKLAQFAEEKNSLNERLTKINDSLQALTKQISALQEEKNSIAVGKQDSSKKVAEINKKRLLIEKEIDSLQEKLHEKKVELNSITKNNAVCTERVSDLEKEISSLQNELHEMEKTSKLLSSLRFKSSNPAEELKKVEEKLFSALEEEKEKKALILHLEDSLKQLQETESACPICDTSLSKEKKDSLSKKRAYSLKEFNALRAKLLNEIDSFKKRVEELKGFIHEERELLNKLKDSDEKKSRLKELRERLVKEKQSIKNTVHLDDEIAGLQKKLETKLKEKEIVLKDVEKTQVGFIDESFERITSELSKAEAEKISLTHERKSIKGTLLPRAEEERTACEESIASAAKENASLHKSIALLEKEFSTNAVLIEKLEKKFEREKKSSEEKVKEKDSLNEKISSLKEKQESVKNKLLQLNKQQTELQVSQQNIEIKVSDLDEELKEFSGVKPLTTMPLRELREELPKLEKRIEKLGTINLKAIDSCEELESELKDVKEKVEKLESERDSVLQLMEKIDVRRKNVFLDCFNKINSNFSKMFSQLFGGEASLKLTSEEDPFTSGLIIEAQHKGKGLQRIDAMSGGEKSLTALAFLFAIQLYDPAPFYIFDEADAALDKENSMKLVQLIKQICKQSQFLMISHNDAVIKKADQIIGVTLHQDKSSVVGLNLKV